MTRPGRSMCGGSRLRRVGGGAAGASGTPERAALALVTSRAPAASPPALQRPPALCHRVALVGNPNVGKSVVFGALTGTYAAVSNYPGTTVEVARALARSAGAFEVIDTPGVNSLTPNSEDERVTRDILLSGVDSVVQVADAKNLPRALVLSLQLAETGLPFILVLNMMDEAADRGLRIDGAALSAALGVPVVPTVAVSGRGLARLRRQLDRAATGRVRVRYPAAIERAMLRIEERLHGLSVEPRWLALLCLAGDDTLQPWLAARLAPAALAVIEDARRAAAAELRGRAGYEMARARVRSAAEIARAVTHAEESDAAAAAVTGGGWAVVGWLALAGWTVLVAGDLGLVPSAVAPWVRGVGWGGVGVALLAAERHAAMRAALGRWAGQRAAGAAMLGVVLYVVYRFVGVLAAGAGVDFLEHTVFGRYVNPAAVTAADRLVELAAPQAGAAAPALHLLRDLLVGPYGLVTVALTYALAIILPIVTAFFLAFSVLEDSGYLPRLALIVNRSFRAMGLNGKAVLPMVLGLGCDTMATLTARIMETRKERVLVTLLLALGVPCSAQLGVILGLFGALPLWAAVVWAGVVVGVLFGVGFLAARLLPGERSDLILELPPIRRPQLRNVALKTLGRLQWYLREAVPIFVLGTAVLFALDACGLLARVVHAGEPIVTGVLGLPAQAAEAFLVGFFRRDYGSAGIYALFEHGRLTPVQAVVALVTITLFVPCVANFFVIVKEHGWRTALAMSGFIFPFAFAVGGGVNLCLRALGFV